MAEEKKGKMTTSEAGQKGGKQSWMNNPDQADTPNLTDEDRRRYEEIRAKEERGEELTTEEAGFLGGVKRVKQASGEE